MNNKDFFEMRQKKDDAIQIAKMYKDELEATKAERDWYKKALIHIRDSTFRNAVTLRGLADKALTTS